MTCKNAAPAALCAISAALFLTGCRAKSAAPVSAPLDAAAQAKQTQDAQTQKRITNQRAKARQQSRTHRVH